MLLVVLVVVVVLLALLSGDAPVLVLVLEVLVVEVAMSGRDVAAKTDVLIGDSPGPLPALPGALPGCASKRTQRR